MSTDSTSRSHPLLRAPAAAGGAVLGAVFGTVARVRRSKPLHPKGALLRGAIRRSGSTAPTGVPWIDDAGTDECVVRISRATGLPAPAPDFLGLAVRLEVDGEVVDLLFASTGSAGVGRFVLVPRRSLDDGPLTTLLPLKAPSGPLVLRARTLARGRDLPDDSAELAAALGVDPLLVELSHSGASGAWTPFGVLEVRGPVDDDVDPALRFEPVDHPLPGTEQYGWVARLREPAYASARRGWPPGA